MGHRLQDLSVLLQSLVSRLVYHSAFSTLTPSSSCVFSHPQNCSLQNIWTAPSQNTGRLIQGTCSAVKTSLLAQGDEEGAASPTLLVGASIFFQAAVARAYLPAANGEILMSRNVSVGLDLSLSLWAWHSCLYRFRGHQSPAGDGRALSSCPPHAIPTVAHAARCAVRASLSMAALSPFQLFAPSSCLFLSEGVDVGSRNTSD